MDYMPGHNIVFIINSLRKLPPDLSDFISELTQNSSFNHGHFHFTKYAGHAVELAINASNNGVDLLVAIGGDGTFNEVVNGILKSENKNTALALIPNGTGNDFCRGQKIRFNAERFIRAVDHKQYIYYDTGHIKVGIESRFFLNIADFGFGAHTAKTLNKQRQKGLKGSFSYSVAILRSFGSFRKPIVKIVADDTLLYKGKLMMLALCNGDTFGNGLIIHPGAKPDDGMLNITLLGEVTLWDYVYNIFNLKKGNKIHHQSIIYHTAKKISMRVINGNLPIETDGEIAGEGDAEINITPGSLKVLLY
jgi:diacylglycerol kinase (ATP)